MHGSHGSPLWLLVAWTGGVRGMQSAMAEEHSCWKQLATTSHSLPHDSRFKLATNATPDPILGTWCLSSVMISRQGFTLHRIIPVSDMFVLLSGSMYDLFGATRRCLLPQLCATVAASSLRDGCQIRTNCLSLRSVACDLAEGTQRMLARR